MQRRGSHNHVANRHGDSDITPDVMDRGIRIVSETGAAVRVAVNKIIELVIARAAGKTQLLILVGGGSRGEVRLRLARTAFGDDVDDAAHRVGSIKRGGAAADNFDV